MATDRIDAGAGSSSDHSAPPSKGNDIVGHPRGLWVLAGTELWDRVSFYGMQALLVLYMAGQLLVPGRVEHIAGFGAYRAVVEQVTGPLVPEALAAQTFGIYVAMVSLFAAFGGFVGDRWIKRSHAVIGGGLLMTMGHFALAFDRTFLVALVLLVVGAGLLRGNMMAQIKALYPEGDRREGDAFQIYYLILNFGGFVAPIITGTLAAFVGWHIAFGFAGFGMLLGLVIYLVGMRHLPRQVMPPKRKRNDSPRVPLTRGEKRRVVGLLLFWPMITAFWVTQSQIWNVYNLWVRDHVDLQVGSFTVPVPWLQSLDGLAPAVLIPTMLAVWRWQAKRGHEPGLVGKLSIGCFIFAAAVMLLASGHMFAGSGGVPLWLPVCFHIVANLGYVYIAPASTALFSAEAPPSLRGTMIGLSSLTTFFAGFISGWLGGLYVTLSPAMFWTIHAAIVGGAGLVILIIGPLASRLFASGDPIAMG
ncbi:peptide MFS transporter [Tsuneonella mangrovi]|uniref:peptide MFS transporter n=1 Tax=Tsuneonella mangrovi TaxID=1982042 RepID=UPI000BA26C70|nr:peptide MFS transporter [Tsuneonella mangrovi]